MARGVLGYWLHSVLLLTFTWAFRYHQLVTLSKTASDLSLDSLRSSAHLLRISITLHSPYPHNHHLYTGCTKHMPLHLCGLYED